MERVARMKVQFVQRPWKSFVRYRDNFPSASSIVSRLQSSPVLGGEFRPTRRDRAPSSTFTILSLSLSEFDACFANSWVRRKYRRIEENRDYRFSVLKSLLLRPETVFLAFNGEMRMEWIMFFYLFFFRRAYDCCFSFGKLCRETFREYRWKYRNSNWW